MDQVIRRVRRSVRDFLSDPVFGRAWRDEQGRPVRAVAYVYVWTWRGRERQQWEWVTSLAELHEAGHLAGLEGGSHLSVMFEAPGRLQDTWAEKLLLLLAAPLIALARIARGDWFTRTERAVLDQARLDPELAVILERRHA